MHIALDCSSVARREATGVAVYIRSLIEGLARVDQDDEFTLVYRLSRWKDRARRIPPPGLRFRSKWIQEGFHPLFARRVDVFHGMDARLPGPWMKAPLVATINDVFSVLQSSGFAPEGFRALKEKRYQDIVARADRIIAISEATRNDVLSTLKADPAKLRVVYGAGGPEYFPRAEEEIRAARAKYGLDRPYVLYAGSLNARKNVPAMVRAFCRARARLKSPAVFALVGRTGFQGESIHAEIAALGPEAAAHVRLLGYVPTPELAALYSGAWGLLFVTHYEGFGIPVVEAFSCGCPVLGTTAGSVPEVAGGAALLADPLNEEAIAAEVQRLLDGESLRAQLRTRGLVRAQAFSWDKSARETLAVYRELRR